jgi:histone deacetylase HOS3
VVKKTRTPAQPRADGSRPTPVRRKSPLAEKGRSSLGNDGTIDVPTRTSSTSFPTKQNFGSKSSDIDHLTTGMKKVKLSLTTKAQRDARGQTKSPAKPTNKPVEIQPSTPVIAEPSSASTALESSPDPISANSLPQEPEPFTPSTPQPPLSRQMNYQFQNSALAPSTPVMQSQSATGRPPSSSSSGGPDLFIPYQPEGPAQNAAVQQEPLRWLPPNTSTPASVRRPDMLPVFTSTSTIPFAPNPNLGLASPRKSGGDSSNANDRLPSPSKPRERSIWDIPETPGQKK